MVSFVSFLMAEIKLRPLQKEILNICKLKSKICLKFVDDVFIIWKYSIDELMELLKDINAKGKNIKYKIKLPDLFWMWTRNGENLDRKICRKHISNNTIPYNSASAFRYNLAAYRFYG